MRWLLGGELHPGGTALTRRAYDLIGLDADDRLLDVGSGDGTSVLLAAREHGCRAVGVEYANEVVGEANVRAAELGLEERVEFLSADAAELPFAGRAFDAAISECSLAVFADKPSAVDEMHRVLRPGGRLALSDVVAEVDRLPDALRGALGAVACLGEALPPGAHRELLEAAGFELVAEEDHSADAIRMADRITERLRGVGVLGLDELVPLDGGGRAALELVDETREAIADGRIGYTLVSAVVRRDGEGP